MSSVSSHAYPQSFGWKSYRLLKKKAMEQELSWSGLIISLSIAFFIVAGCAATLRMIMTSFEATPVNSTTRKIERILPTSNLVHSIFGIPMTQAATLDYQATSSKNTEFVKVSFGQEFTQSITLKNTGKKSWKPNEVSFETGPFLKTPSKIQTSAWKKFYQPISLNKEVAPGQSITLSFPAKAPLDIEGMIQENFQLVVSKQPITGSLVRVFITIGKETVVATPAPLSSNPASLPTVPASNRTVAPIVPKVSQPELCIATINDSNSDVSNCNTAINENNAGNGIIINNLLPSQPIIRVGLFSSLATQRVTADQVFDIYAGKEVFFSGVMAGTPVTVSYNSALNQYSASINNFTRTTTQYLRIVPRSTNGVVTILDYRAGQTNQDNRFRNIIEVRYTTPANTVWYINELPLDEYIKGLAETTNASPVEFQKVMATTARSYALYHYFRGVNYGVPDGSTKHASDHFHVDAVYDQVYRGYNSELRLTGLSQAVEATKGMVVTYNNQPVITPYFSNSDGRTRDWTEVWGSTVMPWLRSVAVPQDVGKTLYGHGVGMSAHGALLMVSQGQTWDKVLNYFYTGTVVQKIY